MLQRTPIGTSSGDGYDGPRYGISEDDIANAKIALVIIVVVFALQLTFAGLALLASAHPYPPAPDRTVARARPATHRRRPS